MNNYILSFTISKDSDYSEVYQSLIEKAKEEAFDYLWDETTSFLSFRSSKQTFALGVDFFTSTEINHLRDKFLLINNTTKEYYSLGIEYPALLAATLGYTNVNT